MSKNNHRMYVQIIPILRFACQTRMYNNKNEHVCRKIWMVLRVRGRSSDYPGRSTYVVNENTSKVVMGLKVSH